jgi:anti-sigma regulatory factor (Ser/Thr protein kinase)
VTAGAVMANPQMSAVVVLPREVSSVAKARRWLEDVIEDVATPAQRRDALLMMSELVTNALRHGHGGIVCQVSLSDDQDELRIAVTDASDQQPKLLAADPERIGGIGLLLLERLAARWGVAAFPGGKVVWATLMNS